MKMQRLLQRVFFLLLLFFSTKFSSAQCGTPINNFPYNEDFESTDGGWFSGGISSDWAWGIPSKPVINKAFSGQRCWITGGLSASSYADNERSWLQSPCFDFSALQNPYISFEVFWETELKYDGAAMQYSTDGGNSWINLFTANMQTNCLNSSWYNYSPVVFLSSFGAGDGWSGNVQNGGGSCVSGLGSGTWYTSQHTLPFLAGNPNVIFRFVFASGNICNNYDGFAFDHIYIGEAPKTIAGFDYHCTSNQTVSFENISSSCPDSFLWNFGDANSGLENLSTSENPIHTFSAPGTYTVTFTATGPDNNQSKVQQNITVLGANAKIISPILCSGDNNASAVAIGSGSNGNYFYTWNTNPIQTTDTAVDLSAGIYTLQVDGNDACSATTTITISEPAKLDAAIETQDAVCVAQNGAATAKVTGGTLPYNFLWTPTNATTASVYNLSQGTYSVFITDSNACSLTKNDIIISSQNTLKISLGNDTTICPGNKIILQPGNYKSYLWQDGSSAAFYTVTAANTYWVAVSDSLGCTATDTITIKADCGEIYFPSAFTPNNDGLNDLFGALGNLSAVTNYHLIIFNRWGETVFKTHNPEQKWDGLFKGKINASTYVWIATFTYNQKTYSRKGTVTIIR